MRKRRSSEESEGIAGWMLTYSDLVTLLLTFFVMLFSMSVIDEQKFDEVAHSFRTAFLNMSSGELFDFNNGRDLYSLTQQNNAIDEGDLETNDPSGSRILSLEYATRKIEDAIEDLNLKEYIDIINEDDRVTLRFNSLILFDSGDAQIKETGKQVLLQLGSYLKDLSNEIEIQGHTDNVPINTILFPSNWELSTKRATNVVLFLVEKCSLDPHKLKASGYGEFRPIMPNDSEENRMKNRRIDIVINKYPTE